MSRPDRPHWLIRCALGTFIAAEYPSTANGRVAGVMWPCSLDSACDIEAECVVTSYVPTGPARWVDLDGRGVLVTEPGRRVVDVAETLQVAA